MPGIVLLILLIFFPIFYYWWLTHIAGAPYVPMDADVAVRIMDVAEVSKGDVFYDLGSGDGRVVIAAAMAGAKARGVELDWLRVLYSRFWLWILQLNNRAKIIHGDIFKANISDATVVCTYLLPKTHQKLKDKLLRDLKKGTKIVAVGFEYDGWKMEKMDTRGTIYGPIMLYKI